MFSGRLGRKDYFLSLALIIGIEVLWAFISFLLALPVASLLGNRPGSGLVAVFTIFTVVQIPLLFLLLGLQFRRLHDIGLTGWIAAGALALYLIGSNKVVYLGPHTDMVGGYIYYGYLISIFLIGVLPARAGGAARVAYPTPLHALFGLKPAG